jgi:hypothetical protein
MSEFGQMAWGRLPIWRNPHYREKGGGGKKLVCCSVSCDFVFEEKTILNKTITEKSNSPNSFYAATRDGVIAFRVFDGERKCQIVQ